MPEIIALILGAVLSSVQLSTGRQGRWKYFQVGGAEICAIIPTFGGLRLPRPPPCYRNIQHTCHALYFGKSHLETA